MSQEFKSAHHLGPSPLEPKASEPHQGHGGTKFEGVDARPRFIIVSLAIIAGCLILIFAVTLPVQRYLTNTNPPGQLPSPLAPERVLPPAPQVLPHPWEELPDLRAREEQLLNMSGKDAEGHYHIPIGRAMDLVLSRLPIRPDAPPGITTPGGEGRDFAGSINSMPAPYRQPAIRGEIHKHAQQ